MIAADVADRLAEHQLAGVLVGRQPGLGEVDDHVEPERPDPGPERLQAGHVAAGRDRRSPAGPRWRPCRSGRPTGRLADAHGRRAASRPGRRWKTPASSATAQMNGSRTVGENGFSPASRTYSLPSRGPGDAGRRHQRVAGRQQRRLASRRGAQRSTRTRLPGNRSGPAGSWSPPSPMSRTAVRSAASDSGSVDRRQRGAGHGRAGPGRTVMTWRRPDVPGTCRGRGQQVAVARVDGHRDRPDRWCPP